MRQKVLILIFLENALRHVKDDVYVAVVSLVLILIFLENALRQFNLSIFDGLKSSLNPYFFGKCSTAYALSYYI